MIDTSTKEMAATPLGKATVQEIQLELIRRRKSHAFNGQRVADFLLDHKDLWEAVMMDRLAISHPGRLPTMGLMKLRDFPNDQWNADTLFVLTANKEAAESLAELFREKQLGGFVDLHTDPIEVDNALGGAKPGQSIVSIWWD